MKVMAALLLLVFAAFAQTPKRAPAQPKILYRWDVQPSGVEDDLMSVSFPTREVGFAAGKNNTILKTRDGGRTWTRLGERKNDGQTFRSVIFVSTEEGWITGRNLLHTGDGADSWQPAVPLPGPQGFGGGSMLGKARLQLHVPSMGAGVFLSEDGGRTWKSLGNPQRNDFQAVGFADPMHGWVAGDYGRLASTEDGGKTWKLQEPPLKANFTKVQFVSPDIGWLLPRGGHQGGPIGTTDGGKTWVTEYAEIATSRPIMDMQFLDAQTGFLLAEANNNSVVMATSSGGKSWRTIGNIQKYAQALSFPAADEGWAVGQKGYIAHYHKVEPGQGQ